MLAKGRIDHSAVKQNFRCVGDLIEMSQGLLKFLVVVGIKGLNPCFDFLYFINIIPDKPRPIILLASTTCFTHTMNRVGDGVSRVH